MPTTKIKGQLPASFERLRAEGRLGGTRVGGGRRAQPGGGRVHSASARLNAYEVKALMQDKERMEGKLGRLLHDSEYFRNRLLLGGETLIVQKHDGTSAPFKVDPPAQT